MHRVSSPSLKLLSAVGVILTIVKEVLRSALKKRQRPTYLRGVHPPLPTPAPGASLKKEHREREGVRRVSPPWLRLLGAVGVILLVCTYAHTKRKSSAQHPRSDNHN